MNVVFVLVGVGDAGSHLALSTLSLILSRLTSYTTSRLTATKKHLRLRLQETQISCYKWEYFLQEGSTCAPSVLSRISTKFMGGEE